MRSRRDWRAFEISFVLRLDAFENVPLVCLAHHHPRSEWELRDSLCSQISWTRRRVAVETIGSRSISSRISLPRNSRTVKSRRYSSESGRQQRRKRTARVGLPSRSRLPSVADRTSGERDRCELEAGRTPRDHYISRSPSPAPVPFF